MTTILSRVIPPSAIQVGALVDIDDPVREILKLDCPVTYQEKTVLQNITDLRSDGKSYSFGTSLAEWLGIGCKLKKDVSIEVSASELTIVLLPNATAWLEGDCSKDSVRRWIERQIQDMGPLKLRMHLVVGLHTIKNVLLSRKRSHATEHSIKMTAPVLELFGDPGILGPLVDPGVSGGIGRSDEEHQKLMAGEMVWAIQYRRVKFNWFSSNKIERAVLSRRNCWKVLTADRGEEDWLGEGDDEDVLEAELDNEQEHYNVLQDKDLIYI